MANQLFEDGTVVEVSGQTLECVSVSYREVDGEKTNFTYTFRLHSEVEAEREADRKAREAAEKANAEAEDAQPNTEEEQ